MSDAKGEESPVVYAQNERGEYVPAIPEPMYFARSFKHAQCECGERFMSRQTYRGHYALVHILGLT